jgi:glycosyltransferase involved in cell wall biosynthesis
MNTNLRKKLLVISQREIMNTVGGAISIFFDLCNMLSDEYDIVAACYGDGITSIRPSRLKDNISFIDLRQINKESYTKAVNLYLENNRFSLIIIFFPYWFPKETTFNSFNETPKLLLFRSRPDIYFNSVAQLDEDTLSRVYKNTSSQILFSSYFYMLPDFIKKSPVICIPNAITLPQNYENVCPEKYKNKFVYFSRMDCFKGVEFLIKSLKYLPLSCQDWQLDIYGQVVPQGYIEILRKLIDRTGLTGKIHFKGISSTPYETLKKYQFAVFPSLFEGCPVGLQESLAAGLPCVGLKSSSGVNELIIDGKNGFLTNFSPMDFSKKIQVLIEDELIRNELSKNASKLINFYSHKIIDAKWKKIIKLIISGELNSASMKSIGVAVNGIGPKFRLFKLSNILKHHTILARKLLDK